MLLPIEDKDRDDDGGCVCVFAGVALCLQSDGQYSGMLVSAEGRLACQ